MIILSRRGAEILGRASLDDLQTPRKIVDRPWGEAPMAAQGHQVGELTFLGPAGDRLGRDAQNAGHLTRRDVRLFVDRSSELGLAHLVSLSVATPLDVSTPVPQT